MYLNKLSENILKNMNNHKNYLSQHSQDRSFVHSHSKMKYPASFDRYLTDKNRNVDNYNFGNPNINPSNSQSLPQLQNIAKTETDKEENKDIERPPILQTEPTTNINVNKTNDIILTKNKHNKNNVLLTNLMMDNISHKATINIVGSSPVHEQHIKAKSDITWDEYFYKLGNKEFNEYSNVNYIFD